MRNLFDASVHQSSLELVMSEEAIFIFIHAHECVAKSLDLALFQLPCNYVKDRLFEFMMNTEDFEVLDHFRIDCSNSRMWCLLLDPEIVHGHLSCVSLLDIQYNHMINQSFGVLRDFPPILLMVSVFSLFHCS